MRNDGTPEQAPGPLMIKYIPELTSVVLEEIPDRVTLAVEITQCQGRCEGCHSPFLREDGGVPLTEDVIDALVADNFGVDCFLFLGEGRDPEALLSLAGHVRSLGLKAALYSGREDVEDRIWEAFDYVKTGPYIPAKGPLDSPSTNQRLYRRDGGTGRAAFTDITDRFWRRGIDPIIRKQ